MGRYVAVLPGSSGRLILASLMLLLAACGGGVKLEAGQAYCSAMGDDPESSDPNQTLIPVCNRPEHIYIASDDSTLVSLRTGAVEATRGGSRPAFSSLDGIATTGFKPIASISGSKITLEEGVVVDVRMVGDKFQLSMDGQFLWLIPAQNEMGHRMTQLRNELEVFDPASIQPETGRSFVDVPLCYYEVQFRNGEKTYEDNLCRSYVTFFTSTGRIVTLDLDDLEAEGEPNWEFQDRWIERGGVGYPSESTGFKWIVSEDGTLQTELKKESGGTTYAGYGYVPSTSAVAMAYPKYKGDRYEEISAAYAEAYPKFRRFEIISKYVE